MKIEKIKIFFRKSLYFKKKDVLIDSYAILNKFDRDIVVTAENKFRELKYIFNEKQKKLKKLSEVKEKLNILEMIAMRYVTENNKGDKKK